MLLEEFGLFFPEEMSSRDHRNLDIAQVRRVMLTESTASMLTLSSLHARGFRTVVRLDEGKYYTPEALHHFEDWYAARAPYIDVVILGCEPDWAPVQYNWHDTSDDWGNEYAFTSAFWIFELAEVVHAHGGRCASPGWRQRDIDGRFGPPPDDGPQPGLGVWLSNTYMAYRACDLYGTHIYTYDPSDYDRDHRFERQLNDRLTWFPGDLIIDECNVGSGTQVERMVACLRRAYFCLDQRRVRGFFPFVSNGLGNAYDRGLIMTDEECYRYVARFMAGERI